MLRLLYSQCLADATQLEVWGGKGWGGKGGKMGGVLLKLK